MRTPDARRRAEDELRALARQYVRVAALRPADMQRELAEAIDVELPGTDAEILARAWIAGEQAALTRSGEAGSAGRGEA